MNLIFSRLIPLPNLTPDILILLLQIRLNKTTITADTEDDFLKIALSLEERDVVKFLWFKEDLKAEFEVSILTREIFGETSSSFLLNATIKHHIKKYRDVYPAAFVFLNSRSYVDDFTHNLEYIDLAYMLHDKLANR